MASTSGPPLLDLLGEVSVGTPGGRALRDFLIGRGAVSSEAPYSRALALRLTFGGAVVTAGMRSEGRACYPRVLMRLARQEPAMFNEAGVIV